MQIGNRMCISFLKQYAGSELLHIFARDLGHTETLLPKRLKTLSPTSSLTAAEQGQDNIRARSPIRTPDPCRARRSARSSRKNELPLKRFERT